MSIIIASTAAAAPVAVVTQPSIAAWLLQSAWTHQVLQLVQQQEQQQWL